MSMLGQRIRERNAVGVSAAESLRQLPSALLGGLVAWLLAWRILGYQYVLGPGLAYLERFGEWHSSAETGIWVVVLVFLCGTLGGRSKAASSSF